MRRNLYPRPFIMQAFRIPPPLHDPPVSRPPAAAPIAPGTGYMWLDEPPAPVRKPSPWRWLYLPASFAVGLLIDDGDTGLGDRVLSAVALVLVSALVAAAFYIWRSATRPAIPAATFILAFLFTGAVLTNRQSEADTETAALQETAARFATATKSDAPIPAGVEARIAWASGLALSDLEQHYGKLASDRDIDPREYPEEWLTARYTADAGDYPQVRSYFAAYRDYVTVADSTTQEVYAKGYRTWLMQAGYTLQQAELMAASIPKEAAEAMRMRQDDFQLSAEMADSALALHAYLVRADARAHYDGEKNVARFERNDERRRATGLFAAVTGLLGEQELRQAARYAVWQQRRNDPTSRNLR
jgi:hypothetical protein